MTAVTLSPLPTRDTDRRVVAGVCAGLARTWGVDPVLVRAGAIILTIATNGLGLLLYLAAWVALPAAAGGARRPTHNAGVLAVLLVLLAVLGLLWSGTSGVASGLVMLGVLAVAWYVVLRASRRPAPGLDPRPEYGVPTWQQPPGVEARFAGAHRVEPGTRRADRRGVLIVVLSLWTLLAVGKLVFADVPAVTFPALALVVVGATLVGGAVRRPAQRIRGLIPLGLILSVTTLALAAPVAPDPTPDHRVVWTSAADLPTGTLELGAGEHVIDLRDLDLDADATVTLAADAGRVRVLLPDADAVAVSGHYRLGMGTLRVDGRRLDGLDTELSVADAAGGAPHRLTLDVTLDMGELEVSR